MAYKTAGQYLWEAYWRYADPKYFSTASEAWPCQTLEEKERWNCAALDFYIEVGEKLSTSAPLTDPGTGPKIDL